MIPILAESGSVLTRYAEICTDPAHAMFEATIQLGEVILTVLVFRPIWKRYKAKVERRAIRNHDAQFHPVCADDHEDTLA